MNEKQSPDEEVAQARDPKHIVIQRALGRLDVAIDNLYSVISQIKGDEKVNEEPDKKAVGNPLSVFLDEGNAIIVNKTETIEKITVELRELLF